MRASFQALRLTASATAAASASSSNSTLRPILSLPLRLFSAQTASDSESPSNPDFDSSEYTLPSSSPSSSESNPRLDSYYRARADEALFGKQRQSPLQEEEERERATKLARSLLEAALGPPDDEEEGEDMVVREEDQMSLSVGIIGAPNAGKSCLTNLMVGTKVAAVSRKTNTTTKEILGVFTKGNTQICFVDTPGLLTGQQVPKGTDVRVRIESAWKTINLYDMLIVLFDVHRHLTFPDSRVMNLIRLLGKEKQPQQKRILCMNKVDLVTDKKDLLKVAREFEDLAGYDRYFMLSGLKGSGVKDLVHFLMGQAVKRPWEEEPKLMTEEVMKKISLEVVRERMLDHIHKEIPYVIEHKLMGWEEFRNGSIRIEQHIITPKHSQRQIIVGKNGSKIGRIGIEANKELRSIFKRDVHLILQVKVAKRKGA